MDEFLELIWNGRSSRRLPCVLVAASGDVGARLPHPGSKGDLVIAPYAALEFLERKVVEAVVTGLGLKTVTFLPGSSARIDARDVAAFNVHFGEIQLDAIGRNRTRACILEITLAGSGGMASFARARAVHHENFLYDEIRPFVRRLQTERAKARLPKIEVTKSYDSGYRGGIPSTFFG
jgi:hypothetical protein